MSVQIPRMIFGDYIRNLVSLRNVEFSSGLSGSFNSAHLAVEEFAEKYPDRKIYRYI